MNIRGDKTEDVCVREREAKMQGVEGVRGNEFQNPGGVDHPE